MQTYKRFHLAFPVNDLNTTKYFYKNVLGCKVGRESKSWIDFNLYGHQVVAHLAPDECKKPQTNFVDGEQIFMNLEDPLKVFYYNLNTHFNRLGYRLMAQDLYNKILINK